MPLCNSLHLRSLAILVCAVCTYLATPATSALNVTSSGEWTLSRSIFSQREKVAAACTEHGYVLSFGGTSAYGNRRDTWLLYPRNHTWVELQPLGDIPALNAATLSTVGPHQFLFGGQLGDRLGTASDALYHISLDESYAQVPMWTKIEQPVGAAAPAARYRHAAIEVDGGFLVMFGISHVQQFNDVWLFTAVNNSWTLLSDFRTPNAPQPRYNPCCVYKRAIGTVYCFGGTLQTGDTAETLAFNIASRSWSRVGPSDATPDALPSPRRLAQCALREDEIAMFSGFSSTEGVVIEDVLHRFNLTTFAWSNEPISPSDPTGVPPARSGATFLNCNGPSGGGTWTWMYGGTDETVDFNDVWALNSTLGFQLHFEDQPVPPPRVHPLSAVSGDQFFILFGETADEQPLMDVWSYGFTTNRWTLHSRYFPYATRTAARCVMFGNFMWVFGGFLDETLIFTNQVLVFDVNSSEWSEVASVNSAPPPVARHGAVAAVSHIIVFGGETEADAITNNAYMLSVPEQRWYSLKPSPGSPVPPARRDHGMVFDPDTNVTYIVGGFGGQNTLRDRWSLIVGGRDPEDPTSYFVTYRQLDSTVGDVPLVDVIRSEMATVSIGTRVFLIGGAISTLFPPTARDAAYAWSARSGVNEPLPPMPLQTYGSAAAYFQRSVFVYGGGLATNGIKRAQTVLGSMQVFTFTDSAMCSRGDEPDVQCVHCSLGTLDPDCSLLRPGYFKPTNRYPQQPCPVGTASPDVATFQASTCERCPAGTFNNQVGQAYCDPCPEDMTCLIGATKPIPKTLVVNDTDGSTQPDFQDREPFMSLQLLALFIACGLLAIVIPTVILDGIDSNRQRKHFLSDQAIAEIGEAYRLVALHRVSVKREEAMVALSILRRTADIPRDKLNVVVDTLQSTFGTYEFMTEQKLQDVVITCMLCGLLAPFPDTPMGRDEEFRRMLPWFPTIDLKRLDFLQVEHRTFTGHYLVKRKTTRGGFVTLMAGVVVFVFTALQLTQYNFENTAESRSILPSMVQPLKPYASMTISVRIATEAGVCVDTGAPPVTQPSNVRSGSGVGFAQTAHRCSLANSVTPTNLKGGQDAQYSLSCDEQQSDIFPGRANCTMRWSCSSCSILDGNASVEFYFGDSRTYSTTTTVDMWTSTGIVNAPDSHAWHRFSVSSPELLRRGFPTTSVKASMLKTSVEVEAQKSLLQPGWTDSGYHVEFEPAYLEDGNFVTARTFDLFTGLPITVVLQEQTNTLLVKRLQAISFIDFVAAMLGGVTGVVGAAIVMMRSWEFLVDLTRARRRRTEFFKDLTSSNPKALSRSQQSHATFEPAGMLGGGGDLDDLEEMLRIDIDDPIGTVADLSSTDSHPTLLIDPESEKLDNARRFQMQLLELMKQFV